MKQLNLTLNTGGSIILHWTFSAQPQLLLVNNEGVQAALYSHMPGAPACQTGTAAPCRIGGCSREVCADHDVITTCEFQPWYACYRTARCERQPDGRCDWTPTAELQACLLSNGVTR